MTRRAQRGLAPLVLAAALAGCGKYGPPVRPKKAPRAAVEQPAPAPAAETPPAAPAPGSPDVSQPQGEEPKP